MAMGRSNRERQADLWIAGDALPRTPGHPFYEKLNAVLDEQGFDAFVERECAAYYAEKMGRPGLPPAVYFKLLFIGFSKALTRNGASRGGWRTRWPCGTFWAMRLRTARRTIRRYLVHAG